ncbi:substrate-binding domain-containing protein [Arthrobacter sp. R4-81]
MQLSRGLSLFCAIALRKAVEERLLEFRQVSGQSVEAHYAPTNVLMQEIDDGARPDVIIGVTSAVERLGAMGLLDATTLAPFAKSGIGVAVPPGTDPPDVSTVKSLTAALMAARSVAYSRYGPSGVYFARLLRELGISERVNQTAAVVDQGFTALALLDGRSDLAVQQLSELQAVPGVRIAGPLPDPVQHHTHFSIAMDASALGPASAEGGPAAELFTFLTAGAAAI